MILWVPREPGIEGEKFIVTFVDNYSNFLVAATITKKSEIFEEFRKYVLIMRNQFPNDRIAYFRCDNAKEYIDSAQMEIFCSQNGIILDPVPPYSPELNGVAERMNRTIMEKIRAMLLDSNLSFNMWPYALRTAVYLINRSPSKVNNFKTRFEIFFGSNQILKI